MSNLSNLISESVDITRALTVEERVDFGDERVELVVYRIDRLLRSAKKFEW